MRIEGGRYGEKERGGSPSWNSKSSSNVNLDLTFQVDRKIY